MKSGNHGTRRERGFNCDPFRLNHGDKKSPSFDSEAGPMQNRHNVSLDSGLSPSPLDVQQPHRRQLTTIGYCSPQRISTRGRACDGYRSRRFSCAANSSCDEAISNCSTTTPSPKPTSKLSKWSFGRFFNRQKNHPPPPLPPKSQVYRKPNVMESSFRPGSSDVWSNESSSTEVQNDFTSTNWKQNVEFEKASLIVSSEEDDEVNYSIPIGALPPPEIPMLSTAQFLKVATLNPYPEMYDSFPLALELSGVLQVPPPPPPPRDPRKKLFLAMAPSSGCDTAHHRQLSEVSLAPPLPARRRWTSASPCRQSLVHLPRSRSNCERFPVSSQEFSLPSSSSSSWGRNTSLVRKANIRRSVPNFNSGTEYWKSPPPPFVPTACNNVSLPHPRFPFPGSARDSKNEPLGVDDPVMKIASASYVTVTQGKSSPSSLSSKDSGCSFTRPLSTVIEADAVDKAFGDCDSSSESSEGPSPPPQKLNEVDHRLCREHSIDVKDSAGSAREDQSCLDSKLASSPSPSTSVERVLEFKEDLVHVSDCDERSSEGSYCSSTGRSTEKDPGFSSSFRRRLFRKAIHDIEDSMLAIAQDFSLLDRAERRDLPTAHQELIAKTRKQEPEDASPDALSLDLDNILNWNTSSSFANFESCSGKASRSRTPPNRRSAVLDKKTDDVVYRICKANNKPVAITANPISKVSHSFLDRLPAVSEPEAASLFGLVEPDIFRDDVTVRQVRDLNNHCHQVPLDPQPRFGMPVFSEIEEASSHKRGDYLHLKPDPNKYRSTFNPMKNPDVVRDDLAFRNLRKDDKDDPEKLGIYKDPNVRRYSSSCWQHRNEGRVSPLVFYPQKNNKLMKALAEQVKKIIRQQNGQSSGGEPNQILTYEEVVQNPEVLESLRKALGISESELEVQDENDVIVNGKPRWAGKSVYSLLAREIETLAGEDSTYEEACGEQEAVAYPDRLPETDSNFKPILQSGGEMGASRKTKEPEKADDYVPSIVGKGEIERNTTVYVEGVDTITSLYGETYLDPIQPKNKPSTLDKILSNEENPALLILCCFLVFTSHITGFDFISLIGIATVLLSVLNSFLI